jgi:hypothetical protein
MLEFPLPELASTGEGNKGWGKILCSFTNNWYKSLDKIKYIFKLDDLIYKEETAQTCKPTGVLMIKASTLKTCAIASGFNTVSGVPTSQR